MKSNYLNVKNVLVIPSYRELDTLPNLLQQLAQRQTQRDCIIISDDSEPEIQSQLVKLCNEAFKSSSATILFSLSKKKNGRGYAVWRGIVLAVEKFPNLEQVMECDADGSHQASDILILKNLESNSDIIIGSRYLPDSSITGWPFSRKIFSKILNKLIPFILDLPVSDATNGLRRYSLNSIKILSKKKPINYGFIYLSEQALILKRNNMKFEEIAINFVDRNSGVSSVGYNEIINSFIGLLKLTRIKRKIHITNI